jgi:uncharacterized protein DUF4380
MIRCSRRSLNLIALALVSAAGLWPGRVLGQVEVLTVAYHDWPQSVEISNADVRVVVVPAIGRIMYFGFQGGQNVLWNDPDQNGRVLPTGSAFQEDGAYTWTNFGGDKVWPTEQDAFERINGHGWPPDHWFDGGRHTVQILRDGVRLASPLSGYNGARSVRTIRLAPQGSRLTIHQELEKVAPAARKELEPLEYTIWNVTQIVPPEQVLFPLNPHSGLENRFRAWDETAAGNFRVEGDIGIFVPDGEDSQKSGADSDRWLAAIVGQTVVAEFFRRDSTQPYPDGGLSAEAYTCLDYTELELLSPLRSLRVGEAMSFSIRWELHRLPQDARTPGARRQAALEWLWAVSGR